ncbi:MAG: iron complex outermembrane receptor protein [Halieaceae bacterium]|jgi:iron complex outermembrane receptor protein
MAPSLLRLVRCVFALRLADNRVATALILGILCCPQFSAAQPAFFDIKPQSLARALIQFSHQADMAIVFADDVARGLAAPLLEGDMETHTGLEILLAGTGLTFEIIDYSIIAIYRANCEHNQSCPGPEELLTMKPLYLPELEEVYIFGRQVTGSRIRRGHYQGSAPVDIVSAPDIEFSGAQTIGEILKFLPAVSGNSTSTAISNGGDGTATVTLRGLPASNTLVLINGRRIAHDGLAGESVDLNTIAPATIERIEILKDGASAIYGSDAIAGVINIILKRDFEGLLAETYYGTTTAGDLQTRTHTIQYGTGTSSASIFLSASKFEQGSINSRDRAVSRSADTRALGGADLRSSATPNPRITLPNGEVLIHDSEAGRYRTATDNDLFDFAAFTTAVVPSKSESIYGSVSYDFSTKLTAVLDVGYLENKAHARLAPTPIFTAFEQIPLTIAADNIYNPFGVTIEDVRRRVVELPPRQQINEAWTNRLELSLQGNFNNWDWNLNYDRSKSSAKEALTGLINATNLQRGLGPASNCRGGDLDNCVPINLFGPAGSIDSSQLDYLAINGKVSGYSKINSLGFHASGSLLELSEGAVDLALGFEFRRNSVGKKPGSSLAGISTLGGSNLLPSGGRREVNEFYLESVVPLWQSTGGNSSLDLEMAVRYSDYSDFGATTNPKFGARLQVNQNIMLRATYGEGFRAPTLKELFEGDTEDQAFLDDPCAVAENIGVLAGCSQLADPTRIQFLTISGGNAELEPEESTSLGLGIVWSPGFAPGLNTTLDVFSINQDNVVGTGAQFTVNQNAINGSFDDRISRDEQGNLQQITATRLNIGKREVRGIDLSISYRLPKSAWGQMTAALDVSHIAEYRIQADPTSTSADLAGRFTEPAAEGDGAIPEWKGNLGLHWSRGRWRGSYDVHYISALDEEVPSGNHSRVIFAWLIQDVQLSYLFPVGGGLRFSLGIDNVANEPAPFAASAFNDNIDARTHDLRQRFWYAKLSQRI